MTPMKFRAALNSLRWTASFVARECGYTRQAAARWQDGTARIPETVEEWLLARLEGNLSDPPMRINQEPYFSHNARP